MVRTAVSVDASMQMTEALHHLTIEMPITKAAQKDCTLTVPISDGFQALGLEVTAEIEKRSKVRFVPRLTISYIKPVLLCLFLTTYSDCSKINTTVHKIKSIIYMKYDVKTIIKAVALITTIFVVLGAISCTRNTSQSRSPELAFVGFSEPRATIEEEPTSYNEQPVATPEREIEEVLPEAKEEQIVHSTQQVTEITIQDDDHIYTYEVDRMPEFQGGHQGRLRFLSENGLTVAITDNRVITSSFIVEVDGSLTDIRILGGGIMDGMRIVENIDITPSVEENAIRLIQSMPKWTPAQLNGRAVRSRITLPFPFHLE